MTKLRLFEQYEVDAPVAAPGEWFGDWVNRKPAEVSRHLTMGYHALKQLEPNDYGSVSETFGGMGAQALLAEDWWPHAEHTVNDFSESAFAYMANNLEPRAGLHLRCGDSYDLRRFVPAELQIADFGDLTATRLVKSPYVNLLDRLFDGEAKHVVLTDIAGRLLHLHRKAYGSVIGPFQTYEEYLRLVGEFIWRRYGYQALNTHYHRWSAITVFERGWAHVDHKLIPCPSWPLGLEKI